MPIIVPVSTPTPSAVTLADIERATAFRVGPYSQRAQSAATAASTTQAYVDELKTSTNAADLVNLFILRRGEKSDGSSLTVVPTDRQRVVAVQDPLTGGIQPDRAWTTPPAAGEYLEFHHLDPAQQLRPAVLSGLRRCFFEDRATITLSSVATERDLTDAVFWITRADQVRRFEVTTTGAQILPTDLPWAQPFEQGGHVWLGAWPDEYPNTLLVTALRPHWTWVNGVDSATGPSSDFDVLTVDLDYAAVAGHIEAWRLAPARMKAAADAGFQATQAQAAAEFTRYATAQRRRRRTGWNLSAPFGLVRLSKAAH